jgi:hypothetical protein
MRSGFLMKGGMGILPMHSMGRTTKALINAGRLPKSVRTRRIERTGEFLAFLAAFRFRTLCLPPNQAAPPSPATAAVAFR